MEEFDLFQSIRETQPCGMSGSGDSLSHYRIAIPGVAGKNNSLYRISFVCTDVNLPKDEIMTGTRFYISAVVIFALASICMAQADDEKPKP